MNTINFNLLFLSAIVSCAQLTAATLNECKLLNGDLHKSDEKLTKASDDMWAKFEDTCENTKRCTLEVGDEEAITTLNYRAMRKTDEYDAVKQACKDLGTDEFPTTLCKINSELEVPAGKQNVQFFAKKEPVCFAYQCSEKQVDVVDKSPLGCDSEKQSCVVHAEYADCPERPEGAGSGNCKKFQETINTDVTYKQAKDALNMATGSHCQAPGNQTDDTVCKYEIKPIQITVGENFRTFENDETFLKYADACYDAGGQTCYMSLNSRIVGQVVVFNLDVTGDYNDFPVCFPSECQHEDKEAYAKELLATNMANKISDSLKDRIMRRRLDGHSDFEDNVDLNDHFQRLLQFDSNGDPCPLGMQQCDATVVDFFCTGRDGKAIQTVDLTMPSSSTRISSYMSFGFLFATLSTAFTLFI